MKNLKMNNTVYAVIVGVLLLVVGGFYTVKSIQKKNEIQKIMNDSEANRQKTESMKQKWELENGIYR